MVHFTAINIIKNINCNTFPPWQGVVLLHVTTAHGVECSWLDQIILSIRSWKLGVVGHSNVRIKFIQTWKTHILIEFSQRWKKSLKRSKPIKIIDTSIYCSLLWYLSVMDKKLKIKRHKFSEKFFKLPKNDKFYHLSNVSFLGTLVKMTFIRFCCFFGGVFWFWKNDKSYPNDA